MKIVKEGLDSAQIDELLRKLPCELRDAIVMRFYEGKSNREIADECGIGVHTVHVRLSRGISLIRKKLYSMGILTSDEKIRDLLSQNIPVHEPEALFSKVMQHIFGEKTAEFNLV